MQTIFDTAIDLQHSLYKVHPIAAIWFDTPIQTATERTVRIAQGHLVRVEKDRIVNVSPEAKENYKVVECFGNISNSILYFHLEHLTNGYLLTLNIK